MVWVYHLWPRKGVCREWPLKGMQEVEVVEGVLALTVEILPVCQSLPSSVQLCSLLLSLLFQRNRTFTGACKRYFLNPTEQIHLDVPILLRLHAKILGS